MVKLLTHFPLPKNTQWTCSQSCGQCSMQQALKVVHNTIMQCKPAPAQCNKLKLTYKEAWLLMPWFLTLYNVHKQFIKHKG
ncbi:uncharacterized protein ACA1_056770 [Acanthamoeba castellanii str. Neff]|uniref:Uncharacterized protein n=1 Tax=Acanthamoeba castellanii (strain ATCC 30010 / Neff) TaxID=1257118 RepID=L8GY96_ACACF|nr:uncharacterized protein ACA1_056770 [Acanthamoeba castellanii str. Neff]ELR17056.1 hypothetical protein ACA1_056770 [Acanthamoeba castellanii str. Neff]